MSTRHYLHLREIPDHYTTYIFDIWGVIHNGVAIYPGVLECLSNLKAQGKRFCFLSNSPRGGAHHESFFEVIGIPRDLYEFIYTSGDALFTAIDQAPELSRADDFFFLGDEMLHQPVISSMDGDRVPFLEEAKYILCTAPVPTYSKILQEARSLGLPMLCSNPDRFAIQGTQKIMCAGSVAEEYEQQGGQVFYCGKPERFMFESALQRLGNPLIQAVLMIGDGLMTDVKGAQTVGMDSLFLYEGVHRDDAGSDVLDQWFESKGIRPTYTLPSLQW